MENEIISRKDAKLQHKKRYFTGISCPNQHTAERYVSTGGCVECINNNQKKNRSKYQRKYIENNRQKVNEQNRKWCHNNPEKVKGFRKTSYARSKQWYEAYYKQHKDVYRVRGQAYRDANKHKTVFWAAQRRSAMRNATPVWYLNERKEILRLYEQSQQMSTDDVQYHIDHIVPIQNEFVCGLHCLDNLQIVTATHNLKKSNKHSG